MRKLLERFAGAPPLTGERVLDEVRGTLVLQTPEERVRQEVLRCLRYDYGYPLVTLQCEEPVARGTHDRRRADVIVRLPRRPELELAEGAPSAFAPYSKLVDAVRDLDDVRDGALRPVAAADGWKLTLDGVEHDCDLLCFLPRADGITAAFEPDERLRARGSPPMIEFLVLGFDQSRTERDITRRLGLRQIVPETFSHFLEKTGQYGSGIAEYLFATSATTGYMVLPGEDFAVGGVLFEVDTSKATDAVGRDVNHERPELEPREPAGPHASVIVVECKAPDVGLTEEAREQARRYAEKLAAPLFVVTNGLDARVFSRHGNQWQRVEDIPSYDDATANPKLELRRVDEVHWTTSLPAGLVGGDLLRTWVRSNRLLSKGFSEAQMCAICRLVDLLSWPDELFGAPTAGEPVLHEDLGNTQHRTGFPGRGEYRAYYRRVRMAPGGADEMFVGAAVASEIFRSAEWAGGAVAEPITPYLHVGVSKDATFESVLQLDLKKYLRVDGTTAVLWHDGKLTAGLGAVSPAVVLDAVEEGARRLLRGRRLELFRFDIREAATKDTAIQLLTNLAAYALVRVSVRERVKRARRASKGGR